MLSFILQSLRNNNAVGGGGGGGLGNLNLLEITAQDLLGKSHEELVLLLIHVRRQAAALAEAADVARAELERNPAAADTRFVISMQGGPYGQQQSGWFCSIQSKMTARDSGRIGRGQNGRCESPADEQPCTCVNKRLLLV